MNSPKASEINQTLEAHTKIKVMFDELEYVLAKDIPNEEVVKKISSIDKELEKLL